MKTTKITVAVKKVDGEWQAVVYVNGKRDDTKTYYTLGGDKEHKSDAEATAAIMQKKYEETQEFCCKSFTRKEILDQLNNLLEVEDTQHRLAIGDLSDTICQQYATAVGEITARGDDGYADALAEIGQNILSEMGISLEGGE